MELSERPVSAFGKSHAGGPLSHLKASAGAPAPPMISSASPAPGRRAAARDPGQGLTASRSAGTDLYPSAISEESARFCTYRRQVRRTSGSVIVANSLRSLYSSDMAVAGDTPRGWPLRNTSSLTLSACATRLRAFLVRSSSTLVTLSCRERTALTMYGQKNNLLPQACNPAPICNPRLRQPTAAQDSCVREEIRFRSRC